MSTASRGLMRVADKLPTMAGPLAESGGRTSALNAQEASPWPLGNAGYPRQAPVVRGLGRPPLLACVVWGCVA